MHNRTAPNISIGVTISDNLQWKKCTQATVAKASRALGLIISQTQLQGLQQT